MKQLDRLIDSLNTDELSCVTVYDNDEKKHIYRNIIHQTILDDYGSAEDFFEHLNKNGNVNLTLYPRRKSGNAFKIAGESFDVTFGKEKKAKMENKKPKAKKKKKKSSDSFGLNATEVFDLKLQAYDRDRISKELETTKAENAILKAKNDELTEEKLLRKYTKEKNDSLNNTITGALKQVPVIMRGLGYNVPGAEGLNSPETIPANSNLTEVQKDFIQVIEKLDDDMVTVLQTIFNKINQPGDENHFATELQALLEKHNMIVV